MHYKNGRQARQGDIVLLLAGAYTMTGIAHNISITPISGGFTNGCANAADCLHMDDILAAANKGLIADSSANEPCRPETPTPRVADLQKALTPPEGKDREPESRGDEPESRGDDEQEPSKDTAPVAHRTPNLTQANLAN